MTSGNSRTASQLVRARAGCCQVLVPRRHEKPIATRLWMSPDTVHAHLKRPHRKVSVHNRAELVTARIVALQGQSHEQAAALAGTRQHNARTVLRDLCSPTSGPLWHTPPSARAAIAWCPLFRCRPFGCRPFGCRLFGCRLFGCHPFRRLAARLLASYCDCSSI